MKLVHEPGDRLRLALEFLRSYPTIVYAGVIAACLSVALGSDQALGVEDSLTSSDLRNEIAPGIKYGGDVEIDLETERNFDLDGGMDDNQVSFIPQLTFAISIERPKHFMAFAEIVLLQDFFFERPGGRSPGELELEIDQLYIAREFAEWDTSIAVGRIEFDDETEWIYDESLDGVRLFIDFDGPFSLQASATRRELLFPKDVLDPRRDEIIDNYMLWLQYDPDKKNHVAAYLFIRNDKDETNPEDLTFLGVQAAGKKSGVLTKKDKVKYWMNAAFVTGDYLGAGIEGYGIDVMGTYVFARKWKPSLTAGIAFGTGDDDPGDSTDHAFRQTGLQDNNARFNSLSSFKYYGELFEPELSNMLITTLGFGLRPGKKKSIDFVYHKYNQHRADDDIRDSKLDTDPNGLSRDLGQEVDVIVGYRPSKDVRLEINLGVFIPGNAFSPDAANAYFGAAELRIKF